MPEFFTVLTPPAALERLWNALPQRLPAERRPTTQALGRVTASPIYAPENLPAFARSTMDGYAVCASDTYGASPSLPAYLTVVGEIPMGRASTLALHPTQTAVIHTGGMLPAGADAVVMIEVTQTARPGEVEVLKPVAPGENVVRVGDDVAEGALVAGGGLRLRPQDIGGLLALGVLQVEVVRRPRVGLVATGDEVVPPAHTPAPGQVRDVNSAAIAALIEQAGGVPTLHGIAPDRFDDLQALARAALAEADALVLTAGSSVSTRDMTAQVIASLAGDREAGVVVHGVAVKPGKPVILAVAQGKPVFGLPGNPVSAMVTADLFVLPTLDYLSGIAIPANRPHTRARLTHNIPSQTGRVDYVPARLYVRDGEQWAEPLFGKSNQIFTLVNADGMITIPLNANGLSAEDWVEVRMF
jgi:molybdopterin molybdotransferase